jgi:hypothetical protein
LAVIPAARALPSSVVMSTISPVAIMTALPTASEALFAFWASWHFDYNL